MTLLCAAATASFALPRKGQGKRDEADEIKARHRHFYKSRLDSDGTIPAGARARGLRQLKAAPVSPLQKTSGGITPLGGGVPTPKITNTWKLLGPMPIKDDIQNGGAGIYGFGDAGPKINGIAVDLLDPNTVYIGAMSGIAKSTDGGINWNYISDVLESQSVQALAIDTTTPRIVYAGTGDPNFAGRGGGSPSGGSYSGAGIYRTVNGGASWQQYAAGTAAADATSMRGCSVYKLVVDARTETAAAAETGTVLYAGVASCIGVGAGKFGVWKSIDSGQNWTRMTTAGICYSSTYDVAVDSITGAIYASSRNGLCKSADGGANWSELTPAGGAGQATNNPNNDKNSVSVAGSTVIYTNSSNNGTAYKSTDGGATWSQLTSAAGFCGGQCFYDQWVGINPFAPEQVYFGGVDPSSSSKGGLEVINFAPFGGGPIIHSDQHSYGFASAATTYLGNDGGIYKSANSGLTWINLNKNLTGGLFMGLGRGGDGTLVGGWQDNGTGRILGSAADSAWHVISGGDGGYAKIDPGNSNRMYHTYIVSGNVTDSAVYRTGNAGLTNANMAPPAAVGVETSEFYPTVFMDPETYEKVILGFQNVWRSVDSGSNWTRIGDLRSSDGGKVLAVAEAASNSDFLYAAFDSKEGNNVHRIYVATSAGIGASTAWNLRNNGLPAGQVPTALAIHPSDPNTAYITFGQFGTDTAPRLHVFKTVDQGSNWVGVSTGLPDAPFHDITLDTAAPANVFAASDIGVYNSLDSGKTWARSDIGMPEGAIAHALHFNSGTRKLVVGTYGRGAFELDVPKAPSTPVGLAGAAQGVSSITWSWTANAGAENVQSYGLYDPAASTVLIGSVTTGASRIFTSLTPNTTYSLLITATNGVLESADTAAVSTVTLAQPISGPFLNPEKVFESSMTITSLNSGLPANPATTLYETQFSTDSFATLVFSSFTYGQLASTFTSLQANTTFHIRVRARNHGGQPTDFNLMVTTATYPAPPVAAAASGVGAAQITANWGSGGNSTLTYFECQVSKDSFASVLASSITRNATATFTGLQGGTNHQFRVRAYGHNGSTTSIVALPAATTSGGGTSAPGTVTPAFSGVSKASVTVAWGDGGNAAGTLYRAQLSTASDFSTINFSSETYNLSVLFGNGGAGSNLEQNVTYYVQVQSSGTAGSSAFVNLGSTSTLAADPTGSAVQVWVSSIAYAWAPNDNFEGTTYYAQISTASDFGTLNVNAGVNGTSIIPGTLGSDVVQAGTMGTSVVFMNLAVNTTYYLRVKAVNNNGLSSLFDTFGATATLANPPVSASLSVFITSTSLSWGANSNPSGTVFEAVISTNNFTTINLEKNLTATTTDFTGLMPNTTYFYRVKSHNHGDSETSAAAADAATLAYPPVISSVTVFFSSAVLSWAANSNITGTTYYIEVSTNEAFATLTLSGNVLDQTSAKGDGLSANTTYFHRVRAFNRSGTNTSFSTLAATSTLAALPTSAAPVLVASSSIKVAWGANGNSLTTQYEAQASSDAYVTTYSSKTRNAFAAFDGLPSNTAFASQVRAYGNDGSVNTFVALPSTTTLLSAPTQAAVTFGGVSSGAVTASWASGGNGAGTVYLAQISTNGFTTVNFTSSTLDTSAIFGNGGAGAVLLPNTSYYFQVKSSAGVNTSDFLSLGSTVTFSTAATGTSVISVTSTTADVFWNANSNPNGTTYYAQISTDAFSTLTVTNGVLGTAALVPTTFTGLTAGTAYAIRVRAINHGGTPTSFDSSVSTTTNPEAPGTPGTPSGTVLGHSSITWTWTAASNALTYNVYQASSPATLIATGVNGTGVTIVNLSTNSANAVKVAGVNGSGESSLATSATLYTLALPPDNTAVPTASIFATSAAITWAQTVNSNPSTTLSYVFLKSSNTSAFTEISSSTVRLSTATGLIGCTQYAVQIQNANGDGVRASSDNAVNFTTKGTTPSAPGSLSASSMEGSKNGLNWTISPTEGIASYLIYTDSGTGTVSFTTGLLAVVPYTQTTYTTEVLASSDAYKYTVRTKHRCGTEEKTGASAAAGVASTLSAVRAALAAPESGDKLAGDTGTNNAQVTVSASIVDGDTDSVKRVQFEYKAADSATWLVMTSADAANRPNPAVGEPFSIPWDLSGLAWVSYDLRAVAVDVNGSTDTTPGSIMVSVEDPGTAPKSETVDAEGEVTKVETIDDSVDSTVTTSDTNAAGVVTEVNVQFPPESFGSESSARVTVIPVPSSSPVVPAAIGASAGLFTEIAASKPLTGKANITMSYTDKNDDGYLDGSNIRIDSLQMFSYNGTVWTPDVPTTFDAKNKTLRGVTSHFTFFGAFAAPSANLDQVRVYPNPFRPNSGNANEGRACGTSCGVGQGIVFDRLPNAVTIDIFTATGQRVEKFTSERSGGTLQWNARNSAGKDVATGGYFAVITSPGFKRIIKRFVILR